MKWLCRIGIHSYKPIGHSGLMFISTVFQCRRCGHGKIADMYCDWILTKEQLDDIVSRPQLMILDENNKS